MRPVAYHKVSEWAGRFDGSRLALWVHIHGILKREDPTQLALTEFQQEGVGEFVRRGLENAWPGRYHLARAGEFALITDKRKFKIPLFAKAKIIEFDRVPGLPEWRQPRVMTHRYKDRLTGRPVLSIVGHPAASVESGQGFRTDAMSRPAVTASQRFFRETGKLIARKLKRYRWLAVLLYGDGNLNQNGKVLRSWVEETTNTQSTRGNVYGRRGTHPRKKPKRGIDFINVAGRRVIPRGFRVSHFQPPVDYDHWATFAHVAILPKTRRFR